jgi:hypothetical protein
LTESLDSGSSIRNIRRMPAPTRIVTATDETQTPIGGIAAAHVERQCHSSPAPSTALPSMGSGLATVRLLASRDAAIDASKW